MSMENLLGLAIWSGTGLIVAGTIGKLRGDIATGAMLGLVLGPLLGALATLFATRQQEAETVSRP